MASSYTDLGIEKMATGENAGTWGTKTNTNLEIIEKSIAGYVEQAVTSGGTTALSITDGDATESTSVARHAVIKLTGTITGNSIVTVPDSVEKVYIVTNGTSGAYTVQFKTASGTGITFGVSEKTTRLVYSDGTNLVDAGFGGALDIEGRELVLDADGDTTLTADTDDQIDIKIAGADDFQFTANTFTAQSGSTIAAQALTATTIVASSTVQGTTITATTAFVPDASDGAALGTSSLEFSDLFLADGAVINFGDDQDVSLTHVADTGLLLSSGDQLQFGDSGEKIVGDGTNLTISSGNKVQINTTGNFVVDSAGDIKLDADGGNLYFQDAGTSMLQIINSSGDIHFKASTQDKDLLFKGDDGGSAITALTLDMSDAGAATFNSNVTVGGDLTVSGDDITMGTNTAGNLLIADGTNFNSVAAGSLSEISTVADDDVFIAVDTSGGGLKKIARSAIVSGLATSAAISNVADDSTPQLGGDLDMNGQDIVTTSNADIELAPNGTGHVTVKGNTNSGAIQFNCEQNSHGQIIIGAAHSAAATNTLTIPSTGGNSTLVSDASTSTLTNKTLTTPVIAEIDSSADITLDATNDVNIPANVGLTFGDDGEKIEGDGTNLTIASSNAITFNSSASTIQLDPNSVTVNVTGDITLDADGDQIKFKDGSTDIGQVDMTDDDLTITSLVSDKDTIFKGNDGGSTITALTLDMSDAGSATFNHDVILANDSFVQFGDAGENIAGDGTDLTITTSNDILVDATRNIILDADNNGQITFRDGGTQYLKTIHASAEVRIQSSISDSDILLQGNDGGATITALKLDMSAAGQAQFKDGTAALPILSNDGDTDTGLFFSAADTMAFSAGGTSQFTMADGVIAPVTDNDVDLGTSSLEFKDGYFDGTLHCDVLDLAGTEITSISSGISTGTAIAMAIVFG